MSNMDEVDQQQQKEISALEKKDVAHDKELLFFRVAGIIIILAVLGMFAVTMQVISKASPFSCPHPDCVHHRSDK